MSLDTVYCGPKGGYFCTMIPKMESENVHRIYSVLTSLNTSHHLCVNWSSAYGGALPSIRKYFPHLKISMINDSDEFDRLWKLNFNVKELKITIRRKPLR